MNDLRLAKVCDFISGAPERPLPERVRDAALQALVDWFAVSLAALPDTGPALVRQQVRQWGTRGEALTLYGDRGAAAPVAWVNGTLSHSLDYDDMHFGSVVHATGPTLAAALAVAMDRGCTEQDLLRAFVTGYELATTLGGQGKGPRLATAGWHPTGVLGHFGAVAAASVLLRLSREQVAHALGLAATQAAGLQISGGSMAKPFHVGKAAMNGVIAAELAASGMVAATAVFDDDRRGMLGALFQQAQLGVFDALGREWQIEGNTFKPYAACQLTHAAHEVARELADGFDAQGLREIRVRVNPLALKVAGIELARSTMEGKFSIGYCVALGLRGHVADISGFTAQRLGDASLQDVARRVRVSSDESVERCASWVELDYGDGGVRTGHTLAVRGSPERPLAWSDLEGKFMSSAEAAMGARTVELLKALRSFEEPGCLNVVQDLLAASRDAAGGW